jgi:hypothetical protein
MKNKAHDAIRTLLDADHLAVHALFQSYHELVRSAALRLQRRALAERLHGAHHPCTAGGGIVHPAVREALNDEDLVDEAEDSTAASASSWRRSCRPRRMTSL